MNSDMLGSAVVSVAGRDAGRVFLVVGEANDGRLKLADGRSRKKDCPKTKKICHLRIVASAVTDAEKITDEEIADLLAGYRSDEYGIYGKKYYKPKKG